MEVALQDHISYVIWLSSQLATAFADRRKMFFYAGELYVVNPKARFESESSDTRL